MILKAHKQRSFQKKQLGLIGSKQTKCSSYEKQKEAKKACCNLKHITKNGIAHVHPILSCQQVPVQNKATITKDNKNNYEVSGLLTCKNVFCVYCSRVRVEERTTHAQEILNNAEEKSLCSEMLTLTQSHNTSETLKEAKEAHAEALKCFRRRLSKAIKLEATVSSLGIDLEKNGWHVHTHLILITEQRLTKQQKENISKIWSLSVNKQNRKTGSKAVKFTDCEKSAHYIASQLDKLIHSILERAINAKSEKQAALYRARYRELIETIKRPSICRLWTKRKDLKPSLSAKSILEQQKELSSQISRAKTQKKKEALTNKLRKLQRIAQKKASVQIVAYLTCQQIRVIHKYDLKRLVLNIARRVDEKLVQAIIDSVLRNYDSSV